MNEYDIFMKPLETLWLGKVRNKLIKNAYGEVLEIGSGTGVNMSYYRFDNIDKLICTDIKLSQQMKEKANRKTNLMECSVLKLPFADNTFDVVVATLVLCSVADSRISLSEIKRVLKKEGRYIFIEHICPRSKGLAFIFNQVNKTWNKFACGCNLNRSTDIEIRKTGFHMIKQKKSKNGILYYGIAKK